ncbi:ubiquitin protein ligase e3a [Vairimorpha apis BRL 01]|uniref:HECT-type E3 ubiquitin transferase n=1 Tax=Vairimorpha apis BRL 01 TaxID=1037528 RepID=T0MDR9_9MICR|nr:ubiquitin protein ligase e3a [Vairimorpha apis BRL 01]
MNVVSFEKFYCDDFCNNINLKEEFKFLRTKSKTVLNYSFILPLNLKAELIKLENNDLMKASLQDSFFRSIFEGHVEPYLFITITRENIYSDSLRILNYIKQEDVHKQLRITFKNEEGKTTFSDLKEIDLELYNSLNNMKKLNEKEIDDLELTFTISYKIDEKIITHNLNENNVEVKVTKQNLHLFINKYADYILNKLINKQFDSIKGGFYYVIRRDILVYLDAKELEKIIIGSNEFDINEIKSTTIYNGYLVNSDIIKWFWEIFEAYSKKMKKKLLQFITGNDRIPISGSASLNLVIMKNGCDTDRLPSSQTCFNTLLLPEYSSKDKLQKKMRTALELTAGFFYCRKII